MIIEHYDKHNWYKRLVPNDPLHGFSKSNHKRIRATLNRIAEFDIRHEIKPIDKDFFAWFIPMYEKHIGKKNNPHVYDVEALVTERSKKIPYYSLSLYEGGEPIGGVVFSDRGNRFSYGYRMFEHNWKSAKLPASPTYYVEYLVCEHSLKEGKIKLSHGQDRNPYGINSDIGLCIFKLSVGCYPSISPKSPLVELDLASVKTDALVLEKPSEGKIITKAVLVTSKENEEKYTQVTKYPNLLEVSTYYRS